MRTSGKANSPPGWTGLTRAASGKEKKQEVKIVGYLPPRLWVLLGPHASKFSLPCKTGDYNTGLSIASDFCGVRADKGCYTLPDNSKN